MAAPDLYRLLLQPLHATGIEYMITGSVAAIAYGEPRMTNDVDVVVRLGREAPAALEQAFPESAYYVPPAEVLEAERTRDRYGHFNVIHRDSALRADFYVASDALHDWAFERRRRETIAGGEIWLAPIEYVIVRKLEYFRDSGSERHVRDIEGMLRVSTAAISMTDLRELVAQRSLEDVWARVKRD